MAIRRRVASRQAAETFGSSAVLALVIAAWCGLAAAFLVRPIVVSNDSISNYAHVWYASTALWEGHRIPFRFPEVAHGEGLAFPYAFVPWTLAALLRPVLGDRVVGLSLIAGLAGLVGAMFAAFPELWKPLPAALALSNPSLIEAAILFQLPFVWAAAFLLGAIACWRKGLVLAAIAFGAIGQATHPAVMVVLMALVVLARLPFEPAWRRLLVAYGGATALASPAVVVLLASSLTSDAGVGVALATLAGTVALRATVVGGPWGLAWITRRAQGHLLAALLGLSWVASAALVPVRQTGPAWGSFVRRPSDDLLSYLDSPAFEPGRTYRVLQSGDWKVAMYDVLRRGGSLDSDFFPETMARRSWESEDSYCEFLSHREVDRVIVTRAYDDRYRTNEHELLRRLASSGGAREVHHEEGMDVFAILPRCSGGAGGTAT